MKTVGFLIIGPECCSFRGGDKGAFAAATAGNATRCRKSARPCRKNALLPTARPHQFSYRGREARVRPHQTMATLVEELDLAWRRAKADAGERGFVSHPHLVDWIEHDRAAWLQHLARKLEAG